MPYLVIKVEQCAHCGGTGYVRHPAWGRYWIEYVERFPNGASAEAEIDFHDAFWRAEGYADPNRIPAEEEPCTGCEGRGSIQTEARFEDALREWLPKVLGEIEERERMALEAADADAMAAEWDAEWEAQ
ncbi:hypothetical protein [Escherichia coli]|uniref:hypothetical protein n=1 Tax=Escherichia coli TaxID=562 RepID=UPI001294884E|nr:hypothetical protein [Escherichia coli]